MRTLRSYLIIISSTLGIFAIFGVLTIFTGFLLGLITPQIITTVIATWATRIIAWRFLSLLAALACWFLAIWATWILITAGREDPLTIREDEHGAVEVEPAALANLAKAEVVAQGGPKPYRTAFSRMPGRPVLKVWCDLTGGGDGEGPLECGEKLKNGIEKRLREDFSLEGIRVNVIHQERKGARSSSPRPAS